MIPIGCTRKAVIHLKNQADLKLISHFSQKKRFFIEIIQFEVIHRDMFLSNEREQDFWKSLEVSLRHIRRYLKKIQLDRTI